MLQLICLEYINGKIRRMKMDDLRTLLSGPIPDGHVLSSTFEIENILLLIEEIDKKLEYYKELKKHRVKSIDEKISGLTHKESTLRSVILNTMKSMNEKSLDFPDIGKVSRRKAKSSIVLEDQDAVVEYLDKKGLKDSVVKTVQSIDKRKLNSLIGDLEKQGEVIPGISKIQGNESLSISFEKPNLCASDPVASTSVATPAKLDIEDLDALMI